VELEEILFRLEADRVEREALIDYALATRNEELFNRIVKGDAAEGPAEEPESKEVQSREDFIRQVNLKAWI
jgi:hypothetical protein